jgi:hypothetical protein
MYWDTYWRRRWYARFPGANATDTQKQTLRTGPVNASSASGFYQTLLENRKWWANELTAEGMHSLSLPSPATTNGTWLNTQAIHSIIKSMISRESTWQPRYGVSPGYGPVVFNGLQENFVATANAAIEWGAHPYAKGVIDNQYRFYIRDDGMVWHREVAIPATARMLTILALYHSYSDGDDYFLLRNFAKAKSLAELLIARRDASLQYSKNDPRYGIPHGGDDALHSDVPLNQRMNHDIQPKHWYASAAELYRAFTEMGKVWSAIGKDTQRKDVAAHGEKLLQLSPEIYKELHMSLNKTVTATSSVHCWPLIAQNQQLHQKSTPVPTPPPVSFRGYSEMLYSGALTLQQVSDIYTAASGSACGPRRLVLGSPALDGSSISTPTAYGLAYGLLQHDLVEQFLLHYFAMSAHSYTRGSFTTPESSNIADRDVPAVTYTAAGEVIAPTYLKWMLCFEEPETRTLWLAKATPRDWLANGEAPLIASNLTTRYGRIAFSITPPSTSSASTDKSAVEGYAVHASVTLPASFASSAPNGGIRLRIRAPLEHAGKLSSVMIGGKAWSSFSAAEETIDIASEKITTSLIKDGLPNIVATFV